MKYTKIKKLGVGSFGTVYLIKENKLDNYYALKCFSKESYESFSTEISFLMRLNHPNIVNIINYYETSKYYNIVLPYAKLGTLTNLLIKRKNNKKSFEYEDINYIIIAISRGINYLHQNKIIHCDIKPSNILLFGNKIIKICDFGVSKHFKTNNHKTFVGTPYYIAPEIVNEEGYNNSIDYWSLGVILYELITFKRPFNGSHYYQLMIQIIRGNYDIDIIPEKYKNLVLNLLNQDFKKRYKHVDIIKYFKNTIHLPLIK